MWKKAMSLLLCAGLCATLFGGTAAASEKLQDYVDSSSTFVPIDYDVDLDSLVYYNEYLDGLGDLPPVSGSVILQASDATATDGGELKLTTEPDGKTSLVMETERSYSWTFTMPAEGYASIYVEYIPVENNVSAITRGVRINGEVPFYESQTVPFDRQYQDVGEIKQGAGGDDIRPSTEEIFEWSEMGLIDAGGLYEQPFRFRFNAGENTLQLDYSMGEMKITQIRIEAAAELPTYEEYRAAGGQRCPRRYPPVLGGGGRRRAQRSLHPLGLRHRRGHRALLRRGLPAEYAGRLPVGHGQPVGGVVLSCERGRPVSNQFPRLSVV